MFRYLLALVLLLSLFGCRNSNNANTIISGKADGLRGKKLYLHTMTPTKILLTDSSVVDSLGNFTFRLVMSVPEYLSVSNSRGAKGALFIASPKEQVELYIPENLNWDEVSVKGSTGSMVLKQMKDSLNVLNRNVAVIDSQFDTLKYSYRYDSLRRDLKEKYQREFFQYRSFLRRVIVANSNSLAAIPALYQKFDSSSYVLDKKTDIKYFLLVDSVLYRRYPKNSVVSYFHQSMAKVRTQLNNQKLGVLSIAEGTLAPNFVIQSIDGDTIKLSHYYGRFVLLNFWAPWAKASVDANKNLPEVYAKYKPYGFEIIQISLARTPEEEQKNVTPAMRSWKHASEYKMWNSSMVKLYNISSIPSNILIDRKGNVVAKNIFSTNLYDTLKWYLVRPYLLKKEALSKTTE